MDITKIEKNVAVSTIVNTRMMLGARYSAGHTINGIVIQCALERGKSGAANHWAINLSLEEAERLSLFIKSHRS